MNTSTASPFASLAPAATVVPDDVVQAFLQLAPTGTLVEVRGEVYRLSPTGLWANTEELYVEYTAGGGAGATYDYFSPETLIGLALSGHLIHLLRLGESVAA